MLMDWDKLRIFYAVAEAGSFTHAGETLNLSQSAISRQISGLEVSVKTPLFHRHARGLILTEQGEMLYNTVRDVFHKLSMAESRLTESKDRPSGPLKVTTTPAFGSSWLTPCIKEFIDLYPEIDITLMLSDVELDLGMRQADVAVRMAPPKQPDIVQRQLTKFVVKLYASPAYLEKSPPLETAEDLNRHSIVSFGEDVPQPSNAINWAMEVGRDSDTPRRPILRVNSVYGIYRAVRSGLGIASMPEYMIPSDVNLVNVLPELSGPVTTAYFAYPEEMRHSKRIAVFRDFLLRKVAETNF